jgi:hypothetical protein
MSEQETVSVKLVKLTSDQCLSYYGDMLSMDEWEKFDYMHDSGLFWLDEELWIVKEKKDFELSDFIDVSKKTDTELEFTASWYNGGCGFSEIVEEAFKKGALNA